MTNCKMCSTHINDCDILDDFVCASCLRGRLAEAEALLDSRAGKLLRKGKTFIVVAVDESYFQGTYAAIRYNEIEKGRWTEEDELRYRDACKEWIEAAKGGRDGA